MDRGIRSLREKVQGKYEPKRFKIRTFGACQSNVNEVVIEANLDRAMWNDGVGKITIGDKTAYFDINEMISYLRVCVQ